MENKNTQEQELIDLRLVLRNFGKQLLRRWWLVVVFALVAGCVMGVLGARSYQPSYQAEAIFSVSVSYSGNTDLMDYVDYYDYAAADLVAASFSHIVNSETMRTRLQQLLGTEWINGTITASSFGGTNLFRLQVTSSDPQAAYDILLAVMEVYPQISRQVIGQTQLSVSREPMLPAAPINQMDWKSPAMKGALLGAAAGIAVLLVLAMLSRTFYKADDVKKHINLSCYASVPSVRIKRRESGGENTPLITRNESDEGFCEAFRLLSLKLLRQMENTDEKVIMVTSALPSEGKSCIATNTALALAREGKKVLLIDGDLRVQGLKHALGITEASQGLAHLLSDREAEPAFLTVGDTGVQLLAGDEQIHNPTPLLRHDALRRIMEKLRPMFDYIVVDTPPSIMMADAGTIARFTDRVIFVIRQDHASQSQVVDGIQIISAAGGKLGGFVMNRSTAERSGHYGYGYGYSYRYRYGKKYGYSRRKEE